MGASALASQVRIGWLRIQVVGAVVGVALLVGACGAGPSPSSPSSESPPPINQMTLRMRVASMAREMLVPAAVALLRSPAGEISTTYGTTTVGGNIPVSMADHVRIGSITKTWTGTVILQQAQEHKLSLDDPVSKFRPDVPDGDHITIAQLLNMRSGLYNYTETRELNETGDSNPQKVWSPDELLALAYRQPPCFLPPGTGYHYSNTNTDCWGLSPRRSIRNRCRGCFRIGCSPRSGSGTRCFRPPPRTPSRTLTLRDTCMGQTCRPWGHQRRSRLTCRRQRRLARCCPVI